MVSYPDELTLTPPVWLNTLQLLDNRRKVWGPFVYEEGQNKIIGMELRDYDEAITFTDGERTRTFPYKKAEAQGDRVIFTTKNSSFVIRPIELEDAPEFGYNRRRPGLTKEQLINEALRAFQPRI